jgi:hypothetical protein
MCLISVELPALTLLNLVWKEKYFLYFDEGEYGGEDGNHKIDDLSLTFVVKVFCWLLQGPQSGCDRQPECLLARSVG